MEPTAGELDDLLDAAHARRASLRARLAAEGTDCHRLLHGATEGLPHLAVDRFANIVAVHAFRGAASDVLARLLERLGGRIGHGETLLTIDRRRGPHEAVVRASIGEVPAGPIVVHEGGMRALVRFDAGHQDVGLFLDFRAARRRIRALAAGRAVLNLFAYTGTAGVAAALGGALEVWNVDFAARWQEIARAQARANGIEDGRIRFIEDDCLAVVRELAGQPAQSRRVRRSAPPLTPRRFGLVILDPPRFARSRFGTVDVARDYQSLFKPAWLATEENGFLLAANNLASIDREEWTAALERCAAKTGRPWRAIEHVPPDDDFPSPDGRFPLKVVLLQAGAPAEIGRAAR